MSDNHADLHEWEKYFDDDGDMVTARFAVPSGWLYAVVVSVDEEGMPTTSHLTYVPDPFAPHVVAAQRWGGTA